VDGSSAGVDRSACPEGSVTGNSVLSEVDFPASSVEGLKVGFEKEILQDLFW
jgi:hypothetical protein